jgi:hypothetical protein
MDGSVEEGDAIAKVVGDEKNAETSEGAEKDEVPKMVVDMEEKEGEVEKVCTRFEQEGKEQGGLELAPKQKKGTFRRLQRSGGDSENGSNAVDKKRGRRIWKWMWRMDRQRQSAKADGE